MAVTSAKSGNSFSSYSADILRNMGMARHREDSASLPFFSSPALQFKKRMNLK